jgi:catechol 2,3-dioxygenase
VRGGRRGRTLGLGRVDIVVPGADDHPSVSWMSHHRHRDARNDGQTLSFDRPLG